MKRRKSKLLRNQFRHSEEEEIKFLNSWIEAQKPDSGSNPLALPPLSANAKVGRLGPSSGGEGTAAEPSFSRYSGATEFAELPISQKTKDGLRESKYFKMTPIQRATLPHALCGRDIRGGAKTGSGKTLSFIVPVLERLYRERVTPEYGVGCIIMSPTRELANQIFDVLKSVGRHHCFSAGLLIGGEKDIENQREHVNNMNILVCTPGRLLQHMDETDNFDCSQLQVLVLDEADRILDVGFKKALNAIISQLPRRRQTFLCSATQTKSVKDLERVSLRDPEYISVDEESKTATPKDLKQIAMIVQPEEKMDMLWSFIKSHLNSKTLVFLSTRKQVIFVYEAFKKLRPGIPLKCLHGKMKQIKRTGIYTEFCKEKRSILFCTDVGSRGLDFNRAVEWVVQVDCPEDVKAYIHRVGRTARYDSGGRSLLFLMPSEMEMLKKLEAQKVVLETTKVNTKRLQPVSGLLAALLVKYPDLQYKAQKALITYLRSVHKNKDKEIFDVMKIPVDQLSASLGLPMTPKIRFLNQKTYATDTSQQKPPSPEPESSSEEEDFRIPEEECDIDDSEGERSKKVSLFGGDPTGEEGPEGKLAKVIPSTRVLKKKKLKINIHRPIGTRVVFDEEGHEQPPLAVIADTTNGSDKLLLDKDKKQEFYRKMKEQMKQADKEDKRLDRDRRREQRLKEKMKRERNQMAEEEEELNEEDDLSKEEIHRNKKTKIVYDSEEENTGKADEISIADLEALALKMLSRQNES